MAKKIAVVGTGIMGSGIAANYLKAGYQVTIWNRSPAKAKPLQELGANLAQSPKQAALAADIIFEVTANDESSQSIWQGPDGILAGADKEKILITSATLTIDWTTRLSRLCSEKGLSFFDMPLTGGRVAAESGSLTFLIGGDKAKLESLKPDLGAVSNKTYYFGGSGSGMKYKLVLNSLQATHLVAFGEAMKLAVKAGLKPKDVGATLTDRPGGAVTQLAWTAYQQTDIPLTFSVDWITKDLEYARKMAEDLQVPLAADVLDAFHRAQAAGLGAADWANVLRLN